MSNRSVQLLGDAVARGAGIVLSVPSPAGPAHYKSRFLSQGAEGVWIQCPGELAFVDPLISAKTPVGITFKDSSNVRHIFATSILRREPAYKLPTGDTVEAVLLAFPSDLKIVQRRSDYRVRVPAESGLVLNCWIINRRANLRERPLPSQKLKLESRDISMGGAGVVIFGQDGQPPKVTSDDRLRVQVQLGEIELLVEGRLRSPDSTTADSVRTGIRFHFLDDGLDERLKVSQLSKIIGQLQLKQVKEVRALAS